jgi:hypothetical protein
MTDGLLSAVETHGANARAALSAVRWPIVDAPPHVDPLPGLYAIHATGEAWADLGLEHRPDVPLYVGMSKSSMVTRELRQHFAIDPEVPARTGGSTVRRSFAALLREPLHLRGVPRNLGRPERPANYGLEPDGDARLTAWMHRTLTLAVWPMPAELPLSRLESVETDVIRAWTPPLNIRRNPGRLRRLSAARQILADDARAWIAAANAAG